MDLGEEHIIFLRCADCGRFVETGVKINRDKDNRDPKNIEKLKDYIHLYPCIVCGNTKITWKGYNAFHMDRIRFSD